MDLILSCVWSGLLEAGRRVLIDSHLAYTDGWGFPEGHILSRPCPLHTSTTYPGSVPSKLADEHAKYAHTNSVPPRRHAAAVDRALRAIQGLEWGGEGRKLEGERVEKIVLNQSQLTILLMEKVTARLLPPLQSP